MDIAGISSSDSISQLAKKQQGVGTQELGRDAFLDLFVAQLENQDPLDPVKNEDFVAQLASISSVEQLESLNENLVASIALNQSNALLSQLTNSSALLGKEVTYFDQTTGFEQKGTVEGVKIQNGVAVLSINGEDVPLGTVSEILGGSSPVEDATSEESDSDTETDTDEQNN